jgi:hypothetical protein
MCDFLIYDAFNGIRQCERNGEVEDTTGLVFCHQHGKKRHMHRTLIDACLVCHKIFPLSLQGSNSLCSTSQIQTTINRDGVCSLCSLFSGKCELCGKIKKLRFAGINRKWKVCINCKDVLWYGYFKRTVSSFAKIYQHTNDEILTIVILYLINGVKQHRKEQQWKQQKRQKELVAD